jgi:uncharacterized protein (TIGR01777 family)
MAFLNSEMNMNVIIGSVGIAALFALYGVCLALQRRRVPTWVRHPLRAGSLQSPRTFLVTGGTGFIGQHWCRQAIEAGHQLIVLTRNADRAVDLWGPHALVVTSLRDIGSDQHIDAIVNLAGAPIMGAPWTKRRRAVLMASRLQTTDDIIALIERLERKPAALISMSAIGYYGVRGEEEITEANRGRPVFQSHLCQAWELAAQRATQHGVRVCRLRAGLVFGTSGGALPQLVQSARLHLAVVLGAGAQWLSWIHIDDLVRLIAQCVDDPSWSGAFNATAPEPVRQARFARLLASHFGPALTVRVPARLLRLLLGEMAELLADGQRVVPFNALSQGFEFKYPTLEAAVAALYPTKRVVLTAGSKILYDPACPVCDVEMRRYCKDATKRGIKWSFADVAASSEVMTQCAIESDTARRRVYIIDAENRIHSGLDAIALIWATLPDWRWAARIVSLPIVHQVANLFYDLVLAPTIWRWSTYRRARGIKAEALTSS